MTEVKFDGIIRLMNIKHKKILEKIRICLSNDDAAGAERELKNITNDILAWRDEYDATILHNAFEFGAEKCVSMWLNIGWSWKEKDFRGRNLLMAAIRAEMPCWEAIYLEMVNKQIKIDDRDITEIVILQNEEKIAIKLVEFGINLLAWKDENQKLNILHVAAEKNWSNLFEVLSKDTGFAKAVIGKNIYGSNPFMSASRSGSVDVVDFFLSKNNDFWNGMGINKFPFKEVDVKGFTALTGAIVNERVEVVNKIVESKKLKFKDSIGGIVKNFEHQERYQWTAWATAVYCKNKEIRNLALRSEFPKGENTMPWQMVIGMGVSDIEELEFLYKKHKNNMLDGWVSIAPNGSSKKMSAVDMALVKHDVSVVRWWLSKGATFCDGSVHELGKIKGDKREKLELVINCLNPNLLDGGGVYSATKNLNEADFQYFLENEKFSETDKKNLLLAGMEYATDKKMKLIMSKITEEDVIGFKGINWTIKAIKKLSSYKVGLLANNNWKDDLINKLVSEGNLVKSLSGLEEYNKGWRDLANKDKDLFQMFFESVKVGIQKKSLESWKTGIESEILKSYKNNWHIFSTPPIDVAKNKIGLIDLWVSKANVDCLNHAKSMGWLEKSSKNLNKLAWRAWARIKEAKMGEKDLYDSREVGDWLEANNIKFSWSSFKTDVNVFDADFKKTQWQWILTNKKLKEVDAPIYPLEVLWSNGVGFYGDMNIHERIIAETGTSIWEGDGKSASVGVKWLADVKLPKRKEKYLESFSKEFKDGLWDMPPCESHPMRETIKAIGGAGVYGYLHSEEVYKMMLVVLEKVKDPHEWIKFSWFKKDIGLVVEKILNRESSYGSFFAKDTLRSGFLILWKKLGEGAKYVNVVFKERSDKQHWVSVPAWFVMARHEKQERDEWWGGLNIDWKDDLMMKDFMQYAVSEAVNKMGSYGSGRMIAAKKLFNGNELWDDLIKDGMNILEYKDLPVDLKKIEEWDEWWTEKCLKKVVRVESRRMPSAL